MSVITDEQWQAIRDNDRAYDEEFYYGVKTTRIFCFPSCPSRLPKKENVIIFNASSKAMENGYRACKRCKPTG